MNPWTHTETERDLVFSMRCEPSQQNILITKFVFRLNLQRFQAFINPWTKENFSIALKLFIRFFTRFKYLQIKKKKYTLKFNVLFIALTRMGIIFPSSKKCIKAYNFRIKSRKSKRFGLIIEFQPLFLSKKS